MYLLAANFVVPGTGKKKMSVEDWRTALRIE
jgi:hypothetical protein